jgi:hypothetical protein
MVLHDRHDADDDQREQCDHAERRPSPGGAGGVVGTGSVAPVPQ